MTDPTTLDDITDLEIDEREAELSRDAIEINQVPVRCIVNGHSWFTNRHNLTFCQRCGQDQFDEVCA